MDLAAAGCRYVQLDDTNLPICATRGCAPSVVRGIGEDPDKLPHLYARLINDAMPAGPRT